MGRGDKCARASSRGFLAKGVSLFERNCCSAGFIEIFFVSYTCSTAMSKIVEKKPKVLRLFWPEIFVALSIMITHC